MARRFAYSGDLTHAHRFLAKLKGVAETAQGWDACCPAHDDAHPSLGITIAGDDGKMLLSCRSAKCPVESIVKAVGMTLRDLRPESPSPFPSSTLPAKRGSKPSSNSGQPEPEPKIVATFDYHDGHRIAYQAVRLEPGRNGRKKEFRLRKPKKWARNKETGQIEPSTWEWTLKGITLIPYRLPAIKERPSDPIYIVEGEKCADALAALGMLTTTNPMGAGKWGELNKATVEAAFALRDVVILPDNDRAGRLHARDVAERLQTIAKSIRILELPGLPAKGDVADWIAAGGDRDTLATLAQLHALTAAEFIAKPIPEDAVPKLEPGSHSQGEQSSSNDGPDDESVDVQTSVANERPNDPHRLARLFLDRYAHSDRCRLVFWRQEFHEWRQGSYRKKISIEEIRPALTEHCKSEMDAINNLAVAEWLGKGGKGEQPVSIPVTRNMVANVMQALQGLSHLDDVAHQPAWISVVAGSTETVAPPFPDLTAVVATSKDLIYLPWLTETPPRPDAIVPATPRLFSSVASEFKFDPAPPKAEKWCAFLNSIWPDDYESQRSIQEWFGYILTPDTSFQKMLLVIGPPRSGKGTIREILTRLVGADNTVSSTAGALSERFGLEDWLGKSLAIFPDCRLSNRVDAAVISEKLLSVSGEDPVRVDRKNLRPVSAKLGTRIAFFTNEFPRLSDSSEALVRRFIVLNIRETFIGREKLGLVEDLATELPAIFWWAAMGWVRLKTRGRFEQPAAASDLLEDIADSWSPIGAFLRDQCLTGPDHTVEAAALYKSWTRWCETNGHAQGSSQWFGKGLRAALPKIRMFRQTLASMSETCAATNSICAATDTDSNETANEKIRVRIYQGLKLRSEI